MKNSIVSVALIFSFLAANIQYLNTFQLTYTPVEYPESAEYLASPDVGFYQIFGYVLKKDEPGYTSPEDVNNVPKPTDGQPSERLVQIQINLREFRDQELTDSALSQLDNVLSAWYDTDRTLILRFLYDWSGKAPETEPEDISIILQHMEQTASVYNSYADHILMLHGLFTGNNGEMHHTSYSSPEDIRLLASKLAETADPSIFLSVRTPNHWRTITETDSYEELTALSENPFLDRLGLFNDGMLGSANDTGTYTTLSREEELAFQNALCQTVPNGGEVIIDNPYNDLDNAIADLKLMHVSYLNSAHDGAVLNKWKETIYTGDDIFNGVTGYEYIRRHLGYRFVLRSTEIIRDYINGRFLLRLGIENVGFSRSYRGFSFCLTLLDPDTGEMIPFIPDEDSSCLTSSEITYLDVPLEIGECSGHTYQLYWQTMDEIFDEAILYGNDLPLTEHGYLLGTLSIETPQQQALTSSFVGKGYHSPIPHPL
ncbi:MAG: DUF4832 domain-containing protein [Lachnospiraceae bacterium]|nr:DUF4832 domain-containing protein [Butyrivibrio sp.]MCM1344162.1 DUF4832 domain-containing protein [Muribaculaceae bacterium]MCM1411353.1 DUF4832 domain-containing protein [Lachnospiraceae bacterium]